MGKRDRQRLTERERLTGVLTIRRWAKKQNKNVTQTEADQNKTASIIASLMIISERSTVSVVRERGHYAAHARGRK